MASRIQVERQLHRILESEQFGSSKHRTPERLGDLLAYIVTATLDEKELSDRKLLLNFYTMSKEQIGPDTDKARIAVLRLRKKLNEYYAGPGLDDAVIIGIPKGQYNATFVSNLNSPAQKLVLQGFSKVNMETPADIAQALVHFDKAIELDPELADAWAGKASAYLTMTLHAYTRDPSALFVDAETCATKAISLNNDCWRGHANLGAVYLFQHAWTKADTAFARAKAIAPHDIFEIGGYGPYLLSRGAYRDALALANYYRDEGYNDEVQMCRAGLYFYGLREFQSAKEVLLTARDRNLNFWRTHLVLAFVDLALNDADKALSHMEEMKYCSRANLWPGMRILCLEAAGKAQLAAEEFASLLALSDSGYVQPMQLALAYMAMGDTAQAVHFLGNACDESDPFTAWLHLWPLLDPLRRDADFRQLLRKWKFPTA